MSDQTPETEPSEPSEAELGRRLTSQRPVPAGDFRGALGRLLAATDPGYGARPARLRLKVAGWVSGGAALVALGALEALGHG
jgi:hypothetical protein